MAPVHPFAAHKTAFGVPKWNLQNYEHNLELSDYLEMAGILSGITATFILSLNDHPDIRKTFKDFMIKPVALTYPVAKGRNC